MFPNVNPTPALPTKSAQLPGKVELPTSYSAISQNLNDKAQQDAVHGIIQAALGGVALGAGGLGIQRLVQMTRSPQKSPLSDRSVVPLAIPVAPGSTQQKRSFLGVSLDGLKDFAQGNKAQNVADVPWSKGLMALAAAGGLGLGYHGMKPVFDDLQKKRREESVHAARNEFQQAMLSMYDKPLADTPESPVRLKRACVVGAVKQALCGGEVANPHDDPDIADIAAISRLLDTVYDSVVAGTEKRAMAETAGNIANWLGGAGGIAVGTGLVGGVLAANATSSWKEVNKAIDAANRERLQKRPPRIYVLPKPVGKIKRPNFQDEMQTLKSTNATGED